jgi:hypothetical protein
LELNKTLYEFLIATLPAVALYFVGWGYLYFLLGDFGINIGEINFDTSTIFIYAFSPVYILVRSHLLATLFVIACFVGLILVIGIFLSHYWQIFCRQLRRLPIAVRVLGSAVVFIFILLALIPFLQWAAFREKIQIWNGGGEGLLPIIEESSMQQSTAKDFLWRNEYIKSYLQCSDQGALRPIFADEKVYYLLCSSVTNGNEGYVFEVRREDGLKSVRFVSLTGGKK